MIPNPFRYPDKLQKRVFCPPPASQYQVYKPVLRIEFEAKCVYCCRPETLSRADFFGTDHYLSKAKHPELRTTYVNLLYACNVCNRLKGKFEPEGEIYIPNPCSHVIAEHMQFEGKTVRSYTRQGAFTCELLHLNNEEDVSYRAAQIQAIEANLRERAVFFNDLTRTQAVINAVRADHGNGVSLHKLQELIERIRDRIDHIDHTLAVLSGKIIFGEHGGDTFARCTENE